MAFTIINTQHIVFALFTGLLPSLIWLFFWLKRDKNNPEPFWLLLLCFLLGAGMVVVAGFLQKEVKDLISINEVRIAVWAGIEEVLKFAIFCLIALKSRSNDEAIDPAMYLITIALGFAALENVLYILKPGINFSVTAGLLTGGLRFFGSTLLHAIASGFIGIAIGLSPKKMVGIFMVFGLAVATFFHTTFNLFILKNTTADFLQIYGYLWIAAIISLLVLEKLSRIPKEKELHIDTN
ncbi:PrsW family intramembrane metalloprotease [Candidatus Nomurabacteria bacterium]|nr:PrsW family intramembrane metalloprotease [Candidatus Nomurabacteria bacterium]